MERRDAELPVDGTTETMVSDSIRDIRPTDLPQPPDAFPDLPATDLPASDLPETDQLPPDLPLDLPAPDLPALDLPTPDLPMPDMAPPDSTAPDLPVPDAQVPVCNQNWCTLPAGTFTMGSATNEPCRSNNEDLHQVTLTHSFVIAETETTQQQFLDTVGYNPSWNTCTTCPVEWVTWHEATAFCNKLSVNNSLTPCYTCSGSQTNPTCTLKSSYQGSNIYTCPGFRLPTEAEFEYAQRAGTTTSHYNGSLTPKACAKADALVDAIAWYDMNATKPQPAKGKLPNAWGLFDMSGNIDEWTADEYVEHLGTAPITNPANTMTAYPAAHGGSYAEPAAGQRSAVRGYYIQNSGINIGFRCVRSLP